MTTSALLRYGPEHVDKLLYGLTGWMRRKGFNGLDKVPGRRGRRHPIRPVHLDFPRSDRAHEAAMDEGRTKVGRTASPAALEAGPTAHASALLRCLPGRRRRGLDETRRPIMAEAPHKSTPLVPFLPDLRDFFDPLPALPALFGWGASTPAAQSIRVEAHFEPDAFIVRAELPGIDPEHDVEVTVSEDVLTLRAERTEEKTEKHHSEFRYGSFSRSLQLPADAKPEAVTASYDAGILTVTVPLEQHHKAEARTIAVTSAKGGESAK
jgi:HSP20 family molecular chaperone IbpA